MKGATLRAIAEIRGSVQVTVEGVSMLPLLRSGDVVEIVPAGSVRVGDIVLYESDSGFVLHRVVKLNGPDIIAVLGDHSRIEEEVDPTAVVGRAVGVNGKDGFKLGFPSWATALLARLSHVTRCEEAGGRPPDGPERVVFGVMRALAGIERTCGRLLQKNEERGN